MIVLGDFNIAPDERDVHDPAVWNDDHILTSRAEREALQQLYALGLHDAWRELNPDAQQFSWWDYRQANFRRNLGLRIDLTLVSEALRPHCGGVGHRPRAAHLGPPERPRAGVGGAGVRPGRLHAALPAWPGERPARDGRAGADPERKLHAMDGRDASSKAAPRGTAAWPGERPARDGRAGLSGAETSRHGRP